MTINGYQQLALMTESTYGYMQYGPTCQEYTDERRLLQGLMGLNGEAGEAIDIMKKYMFHGHKLDKNHLAKELGDVAWYLALSVDALGFTLEEVLEMNIEKLRRRYPDGFSVEKSKNRAENDV